MVFILSLLSAALTIVLAITLMKGRTSSSALQQARADIESLQKRVAELEGENKTLAQYRVIPHAEQRALAIIREAEQLAEERLAQTREEQARMRAAVQEEQERASQQVQERRKEATTLLSEAAAKAAAIVETARTRARELTDEAALTSRNAEKRSREDQERMRAAVQEERERAAHERQEGQKKADTLLADAAAEAIKVVEAAHQRAREMASEASLVVQNAERLKQTVEALKNVIDGYGNQYVVPTYGLLDELSEEFGHAEAGQRLKASRDSMRRMIKSGTAAACDYVEENRKSTAIDFVLDAFNGKVDTILLGIKSDNHGTLAQKIRDASNIVNNNGKAFRNARITPEYLEARLDELHWAAVTQELKEKEREEQRVIKERIREEEKAQREYERAMKEAQKEEDVLRKAMEKAQREIEKASDEQKTRYEEQLRELQEKLKTAEEKNQRAISMAQQTKTGHVYVISNIGSFGEDVYKIGLTRRLEPLDRVKELGDASVPFEFDVHSLIASEDAPALERELHKRLVRMQVNKVNPRKEFFRLTLQDIRQELEGMGIQAKWTMTAECREYKETLSIEQAMRDKTFHEGAWMEKQLRDQETDPQRLAG